MNLTTIVSSFWGFIYRIIFTTIPAILFISISALVMYNFAEERLDAMYDAITPADKTVYVLILISLVYATSIIIESLVIALFYYALDFVGHSNMTLFGEKTNFFSEPYMRDVRKKITETLYPQVPENHIKIMLSRSLYQASIVQMLQKNDNTFDYLSYQLGREFITNNIAMVLLLTINLYLPYSLAKISQNDSLFILLQFMQIILSAISLYFTKHTLADYAEYSYQDGREMKHKIWEMMALIALLFAPFLFFYPLNVFLFFIVANLIFFIIFTALCKVGFKEYRAVEKFFFANLAENYSNKLSSNQD